jgi:hypothetical protein
MEISNLALRSCVIAQSGGCKRARPSSPRPPDVDIVVAGPGGPGDCRQTAGGAPASSERLISDDELAP